MWRKRICPRSRRGLLDRSDARRLMVWGGLTSAACSVALRRHVRVTVPPAERPVTGLDDLFDAGHFAAWKAPMCRGGERSLRDRRRCAARRIGRGSRRAGRGQPTRLRRSLTPTGAADALGWIAINSRLSSDRGGSTRGFVVTSDLDPSRTPWVWRTEVVDDERRAARRLVVAEPVCRRQRGAADRDLLPVGSSTNRPTGTTCDACCSSTVASPAEWLGARSSAAPV
jgi:hypothetical protein